MINKISCKTFFVFMCFNFGFVHIVYFLFVESNGYKLEKMDAILAEAHRTKISRVRMEQKIRKSTGDARSSAELKRTLREDMDSEDVERSAGVENRGGLGEAGKL